MPNTKSLSTINSSAPGTPPSLIGTDVKQQNNKKQQQRNNNNSKYSKKWTKSEPRFSESGQQPARLAAEHEAGNSFMDEYERFHEAMLELDSIQQEYDNNSGRRTPTSLGERYTDETASDVLSSMNSTVSSEFGSPYEVIEYDFNKSQTIDSPDNKTGLSGAYIHLSPIGTKAIDPTSTNPATLVFPELDLVINDDSPAAAALRANANVHVSSVGKAARAAHLQSIRRLAKFAAGANKTGYVKGKPPRLPPQSVQLSGPFGGPSFKKKHHRRSHSHPSSFPSDEESVDDDNCIAEEGESIFDSEDDVEEDDNDDDYDDGENKVTVSDDVHPSNDINDTNVVEVEYDANNTNNDPTEQQTTRTISIVGSSIDPSSGILSDPLSKKNKTSQQQHQQQPSQPPPTQIVSESFHTGSVHVSEGVSLGTIEAGKKVLGNVDPHDLLKLQRWRKKQTGQSQHETKSYVKGKVIDGEHELYTLSIAVMIGVRQSISRTNIELNKGNGKRWVNINDFRNIEKYEFRPKGDGQTPPHLLAHTFKFKDYSPIVFAYLRRMYGVNEFDFLLSVCGNANFIEFISNAKSGQFFFYSSDGRYMIKTMTNAESKFLRRILPQYFKHCCENPNTMITRFFGMYRVKLYHLRRNVKFVVMNSVYYTDKYLQSFYDLKGSTIGRNAKPGQAVLKDNDLRASLPNNALALRPQQLVAVRNQVVSDCDFLQQSEIMDYSMLVGVHFIPYQHPQQRTTKHQRKSSKGNMMEHLTAAMGTTSIGGSESKTTTATTTNADADHQQQHDEASNNQNASKETKIRSRSSMRRRHVSHRNLAFDDGLDDDDSSYLQGSDLHPDSHQSNNDTSSPTNNSSSIIRRQGSTSSSSEETERKKLATVEKLYWPFHLLFDIHGHRRIHPLPFNNRLSDEDLHILKGYNIPQFVPPLSDRKDGGYELDISDQPLPIPIHGTNVPNVTTTTTEHKQVSGYCNGKIFYMGIIDILQEYTTRKSLETTYRQLMNGKLSGVSCIPPKQYADRFVSFFEEYTYRPNKKK